MLLRGHAQGDPTAAPATTSDAWWIFTYTRLVATNAREPVPEGLLGQRAAVGEHRRGDEGGRGVAAREAARERLAEAVRAIALVHRPRAAEQRLEPEVDERRLDAEGDGELDGLDGAHPRDGRPRERGEVPDEAVIAERGREVEGPVCDRVASEPVEPGIGGFVEAGDGRAERGVGHALYKSTGSGTARTSSSC